MHAKTIVMYTIISLGLILFAMLNPTLLLIWLSVAYIVTTLVEFSEDWSLALIESVGTLVLTIALGHTMGVTGFLVGLGVSIYGGLVVQWFVLKHYPWLSSQYRIKRRAEKRAAKEAAKLVAHV